MFKQNTVLFYSNFLMQQWCCKLCNKILWKYLVGHFAFSSITPLIWWFFRCATSIFHNIFSLIFVKIAFNGRTEGGLDVPSLTQLNFSEWLRQIKNKECLSNTINICLNILVTYQKLTNFNYCVCNWKKRLIDFILRNIINIY